VSRAKNYSEILEKKVKNKKIVGSVLRLPVIFAGGKRGKGHAKGERGRRRILAVTRVASEGEGLGGGAPEEGRLRKKRRGLILKRKMKEKKTFCSSGRAAQSREKGGEQSQLETS